MQVGDPPNAASLGMLEPPAEHAIVEPVAVEPHEDLGLIGSAQGPFPSRGVGLGGHVAAGLGGEVVGACRISSGAMSTRTPSRVSWGMLSSFISTRWPGRDEIDHRLVDHQVGLHRFEPADLADRHAPLERGAEVDLFQRSAGPAGQAPVRLLAAWNPLGREDNARRAGAELEPAAVIAAFGELLLDRAERASRPAGSRRWRGVLVALAP